MIYLGVVVEVVNDRRAVHVFYGYGHCISIACAAVSVRHGELDKSGGQVRFYLCILIGYVPDQCAHRIGVSCGGGEIDFQKGVCA